MHLDAKAALGELRAAGLLQELRSAAQKVYGRVSSEHDPDRGHDGHTFGVLIWRELEYEAEVAAKALGLRTSRPSGSFCIHVGSRRLFLCKYGASERFDVDRIVWESEIRSAMAAGNTHRLEHGLLITADNRLVVPDDTEKTPVAKLDLVMAHTGSPETGAFGVTIGAPQMVEGLSPWAWRTTEWLDGSLELTTRSPESDINFDQLDEPKIELNDAPLPSDTSELPMRSFDELPSHEVTLDDSSPAQAEDDTEGDAADDGA